MAMTGASPSVESLGDRQTCELACVPGVEGHSCACVSKAPRKGDQAASKTVIRKQSIKGSRHATNMAKQALRDAVDVMCTSTRWAVRRPSSICSQRGESAGAAPVAGGPTWCWRRSATSVESVVAGRWPPAVGPVSHTSCPLQDLPHCSNECEMRPLSAVPRLTEVSGRSCPRRCRVLQGSDAGLRCARAIRASSRRAGRVCRSCGRRCVRQARPCACA